MAELLVERRVCFRFRTPRPRSFGIRPFQFGAPGGVAGDVGGELVEPEAAIPGRGGGSGAAGVAVPVAAVDEDREAGPPVGEVGSAGKGANVAPIPEMMARSQAATASSGAVLDCRTRPISRERSTVVRPGPRLNGTNIWVGGGGASHGASP